MMVEAKALRPVKPVRSKRASRDFTGATLPVIESDGEGKGGCHLKDEFFLLENHLPCPSAVKEASIFHEIHCDCNFDP
jgi:hypothetical protein